MAEMIFETFSDIFKSIPFLFLVYLFLEYMQEKTKDYKVKAKKLDKYGPVLAATAGCVPQCGFSIIAGTLYSNKIIRGGTLIAAFLATSDEAIPIIVSSSGSYKLIGAIIALKLVIGILGGYFLNLTVFRNEIISEQIELDVKFNSCENEEHHTHKTAILKNALYHTFRITLFILAVLLLINTAVFYLGEEKISGILLSGSIFQPFIIALIGMVPGCSTSVLITELLLAGQIPFGSAMAGLCTSTGFGYLIIFKNCNLSKTLKILGLTYLAGAIAGVLLNFM